MADPQKKKPEKNSSGSEEGVVHSSRSYQPGCRTSLTTFVTQIADPKSGQVLQVNALADGGADHTVLSARAAQALGLWQKGNGKGYRVKGHGGSSGIYAAQNCEICLLNPDGREVRQMKVKSYANPCET